MAPNILDVEDTVLLGMRTVDKWAMEFIQEFFAPDIGMIQTNVSFSMSDEDKALVLERFGDDISPEMRRKIEDM